MKKFPKSIEYSGCHKCIANSGSSCKYCKSNKIRFMVYNSSKSKFQDKLDQVKRVNQKFPNIPASKFCNFYYIDRRNINFWSQMGYQRFSSIEHLTSYIINSNNIQPSQLALECKWDLGKLPQIKHLVIKSENLLVNTQGFEYRSNRLYKSDLSIFCHIYNPNFWYKLIKNYIIHEHRYVPAFYLKDFDIRIIPQPLMVAIYCCGYIYFDHKSDELTEYMNQLENINYKKIQFNPSLTNIQALFIHQHILYHKYKIAEARSCLLHITKMCYMLGLHRNTIKLSKPVIYTRNLIYSRAVYLFLLMTMVHKVNVNFQVDVPNISKTCYDPYWQLLPKETASIIKINDEERVLISILTNLDHKYSSRCRIHLIFPDIALCTDKQIYEICLEKYSDICLSYCEYISDYELLLNNSPDYYELISFNKENLNSFNVHMGILIFEYGRSKSKGVNYKLVQKMMNLCEEIMTIAMIRDTKNFLEFDIYLTVFTCVKIFKYLRLPQQKKLISNLSIVKKQLFYNLSRTNLLIYLLFDKSIELLNTEL